MNGRLIACSCALACAIAHAMGEEPPKIAIISEASWNSHYAWRGLMLDTKPQYQLSTTLSAGAFSFNAWSTSHEFAQMMRKRSEEVDWTLDWTGPFMGFEVRPNLIAYRFKAASPVRDTTEAGLGISRKFGGMTVYTNQYLDIAAEPGSYFGELGASFDLPEIAGFGPSVSASLGWANGRFNEANLGVRRSAICEGTMQVSISKQLASGVSLRAAYAASRLHDHDLRNAASHPDIGLWTFAIAISK